MKLTLVVGTRPNFMKMAPIIRAINKNINAGIEISYRLVHTGQHYDTVMNDYFFEQLNLPKPDISFGCGGGSDAEQSACIMKDFEKELTKHRPDLVLVVGDVNSTMACSIVTKKQCITLAHVEAGIRSYDRSMPEEINRLVTDSISDVYFTTSRTAGDILLKNGAPKDRVYFVGNTMIDSLKYEVMNSKPPSFWDEMELDSKHYYLLTLHRPSNVNEISTLKNILNAIQEASQNNIIVFPVHPRTKNSIEQLNMTYPNIKMVQPQGYLEFIYLLKHTTGVITDSGGITEEATFLNIPCVTLRQNTERPETVLEGTNELIGDNLNKLKTCMEMMYMGSWKKGKIPEKWDGKSAERIIDILVSLQKNKSIYELV